MFHVNPNEIGGNITRECEVDPQQAEWSLGYFVFNIVIAVLGTIGNVASICSLSWCQKTNLAVKIQLGTLFVVQLAICLLTLPGTFTVKRLAILCRADEVPEGLKIFFIFAHNIFLPVERINFAALAVCRLVAVRWPHRYKKLAQVKVVVIMEILSFVYVLTPIAIAYILGVHKRQPVEHMMFVKFYQYSSGTIKTLYMIHGASHLVPTLVGFLAYSLMTYTMIRQKQQKTGVLRDASSNSSMDHVAYTIRLLILVNLFFDLPHSLVRILRVGVIPSLVIHNIFYIHLVVDPVIFVGMNSHYRQTLIQRVHSCLHLIASRLACISSEKQEQTGSGGTYRTSDLNSADIWYSLPVRPESRGTDLTTESISGKLRFSLPVQTGSRGTDIINDSPVQTRNLGTDISEDIDTAKLWYNHPVQTGSRDTDITKDSDDATL